MGPGNKNANRRTPFDDNLITDPDSPRDTQPLPRPGAPAARPVRPSRLLPPQAGATAPASPNYADDNDTGALSGPLQPAMARRIPLSAIIGLSMVGGALAVVVISTLVSRALPRPDLKGQPVITAPTPDVIMEKPTDAPPDVSGAAPGAAGPADGAPTAAAPAATVVPAPKAGAGSSIPRPTVAAPESSTPADSDSAGSTHERATQAGATASHTDDGGNDSHASAPGSSAGTDQATAEPAKPFVHRGGGYAITPPPQFKLVRRGRRTIWSGPQGAHLLVETTSRPSRSPFGDWLILDKQFRKAYGPLYRSNGITQTTLAGRPAAIWDFELDTKSYGTLRKIDVAVHANGHGYAVLGSAPVREFDDLRPRLEAAINSFELRESKRRARSDEDNNRPARDENEQTDTQRSVTNNQVRNDLRPDMGY